MHEIRRVVCIARKKDYGSRERVEQAHGVLGIKIHDCEVIVSTNARRFHIRADEKAVKWIQSGLRRSVKAFLDVELLAMSHTAPKTHDDQLLSVHSMRNGVRDKITWLPETQKWMLKYKGESNAEKEYCKQNGISINIPVHLQDEGFILAREKPFLNACRVWNCVDKSGRKRIVMPGRPLQVQMVSVPIGKAKAMSGGESEESSCPDDEDRE